MIRPPRRPAMWRAAAWETRKAPRTLVPSWRSHSAQVSSRKGTALSTPAQFTRTSILPKRCSTSATTLRTWLSDSTSSRKAAAVPSRARISEATASAAGRSLSASATTAPSAANSPAIARPIPPPAPVTSATCPFSIMS